MPIELIVMDLDGTLLDADHVTIPRRNVEALRAAAERGTKLAIASGRTWSLIESTARQLGGVDFALLANGANVRDVAGSKSIYTKSIPYAQAKAIGGVLDELELPYEVYCDGQNYVRARDRAWVHSVNLTPAFADFFDSVCRFPEDIFAALEGRGIEKFNIFYVPPHLEEELIRRAGETGPVAVTKALEENMEFNAPGVSKGDALQALCAHLGLGPDQVMAFGDAGNDLEMLEWAGWSFAMDNGTPAAKAAARMTAPANDQAGVGQMVERYVLN